MVKRRWLTGALAVALISAAAVAIALAMPATQAARADVPGAAKDDPVVLTLTGKDGTVKTYTLAYLRALDASGGLYAGYAGFLNSAGILTPVHPVEGVKLTSLLADVGYDGATDVTVTAKDNYAKLLSPQVVLGQGMTTHSDASPYPVTPLPVGEAYTPVISYAYKAPGQTVDDTNSWIPELADPMGDGPLRLWFAVDSQTSPGYVVDGEWIVKWLNRITVSQTAVQQWSVKAKGPKKTYVLTRSEFESCTAPGCHRKTVTLKGHTYQGLPLYFLVGKVDDNKASNKSGDFNAALARRGYWIDVGNSGRKTSVSSKLIAGRTKYIILAWKRDGQYLSGKQAPLWLIGAKLTGAQRIYGIKSITLRGVPH